MAISKIMRLAGTWVLLTLLYTFLFILGTIVSGLAGTDPATAASPDPSAFLLLLGNSFITTGLLAWPVLRSDWSRLKAMVAVFVLLFTIGSVLPQLDSLFFSDPGWISREAVATIVLSGGITALLYAPVSVLLLFPQRFPAERRGDYSPFTVPKFLLLGLLYVLVYFVFGYYVAWQSPELREFYSGSTEIAPFRVHMGNTFLESPGLFGLQFIRGLVWAGMAVLLLSMTSGGYLERIALVALLFGLLGLLLILLPNPYMPETIREVHFVELLSSNVLFGAACGWYLSRKTRASAIGRVSADAQYKL